MTEPKVAIIVLSWNGRQDTLACLESLERLSYSHYEVIVIDNASTDGSPEAIRQAYPVEWVTLLALDENLGFVGGNNLGMAYALEHQADYVLLLNNDTEVAPDFLGQLVAAAGTDPKIGIAGPTIYYHSQPDRIWSAGGEIDWGQGVTYMTAIGEVERGQFGQGPRRVDFVTGCALLIKAEVIRRVGMLDPRFYAYFEETEWCVRAARAGYQIIHVPAARLWHKISPQAREASPQVQYYMTRNRLLFLKLSQAGGRAWASTAWDYGKRLTSWTVRPRWRHKSSQRAAMLHAIRDFQRGRFGRVDVRSKA